MSTLQARNEAVVNASTSAIWSVITDVSLLPKINPGVIKANGIMNEPNGSRTCEVDNKGRKGTIVEKLVEFVPEKRTVWEVQSDTMGMKKMLKDIRFFFVLARVSDSTTKVTAETHYTPGNWVIGIMNRLMMRKMFAQAQETILNNIRTLTEKS
jgi:hypothetical protein